MSKIYDLSELAFLKSLLYILYHIFKYSNNDTLTGIHAALLNSYIYIFKAVIGKYFFCEEPDNKYFWLCGRHSFCYCYSALLS